MNRMKDKPFALWLRVEIAKSGLRQLDIAEQIGIGKSTISMWAAGRSKPRNILHIRNVANLFGSTEQQIREMLK